MKHYYRSNASQARVESRGKYTSIMWASHTMKSNKDLFEFGGVSELSLPYDFPINTCSSLLLYLSGRCIALHGCLLGVNC